MSGRDNEGLDFHSSRPDFRSTTYLNSQELLVLIRRITTPEATPEYDIDPPNSVKSEGQRSAASPGPLWPVARSCYSIGL